MPRADRPSQVDSAIPLGACETWSVLFSFDPLGDQALRALCRYRVGNSQYATPRAIISAAILYLPEDPGLILALSDYSAAAGPVPVRGSTADLLRRRTHVRIPAPLSLRLNRLIELTGLATGQRCSRTAVVASTLRSARREDKTLWVERFKLVLTEPAGRSVPQVDAANSENVLRLTRPKPGPRPQPACV